MTAIGELAPTNLTVRWQAAQFVRIHDQRIASWTSYFDQLAVLIALGVEVVSHAN
jgi:ketosteroid isomerase-like protein